MKKTALLSAVFLGICTSFFTPVSNAADTADTDTFYTIRDVKNLQDFLLSAPAEESLDGKKYDLDNDGVWSVFDLVLMKQKIGRDASRNEIYVSNTDELKDALTDAKAGDTIILQSGIYESSDRSDKGAIFGSDAE